jgi:hypothetical protein
VSTTHMVRLGLQGVHIYGHNSFMFKVTNSSFKAVDMVSNCVCVHGNLKKEMEISMGVRKLEYKFDIGILTLHFLLL